MNTFLNAAAALALAGAAAGTAQAAMVTPTSATAPSADRAFSVNNLINSSGLSSDSLTATHDATHSNTWLSGGGPTPTILFDLGAAYTLEAVHIWQYNFFTDREVASFDLSTSLDGTLFSSVLTGATLKKEAEKTSNTAQKVSFDGVGRYVKLAITANTGNRSFTGLNEVRFEGTALPVTDPMPDPVAGAVPEPATWAMMILGFGMVGGAARRRRRTTLRLA